MAPKDGRVLLRPLKRSEVSGYSGELFRFPKKLKDYRRKPAKWDFHALDEPETTKGGQLHKFIQGFTGFLTNYGVQVEQQRRAFERYKPSSNHALSWSELKTIHVLDNRMNQDTVALEQLHQLPASTVSRASLFNYSARAAFVNDLYARASGLRRGRFRQGRGVQRNKMTLRMYFTKGRGRFPSRLPMSIQKKSRGRGISSIPNPLLGAKSLKKIFASSSQFV